MNQAVQTVIPPRPQAEGYTEFREVVKTGTISAVLAHPEMKQRLVQAMPKHMSPERMLRVLALAIQKTPKLAQCNVASLLGAIMVCATLGLEPNTPLGHAYLIPFEKRKQVGGKWVTDFVEVNLILGYKGLIDLARRSGSLTSIHADVVYPGDTFEFEYGTGQRLRHIPTGDRTKEPTWAYCYAQLKDGHAFTVLPWNEVIKIRNGSQGYQAALKAKGAKEDWKRKAYESSPWVAHLHAMAAKTALRNLAKYLPMSIEFASAAALDEMSEVGKADLSYASLMTNVEDMVDATAIEDQSGEPEPADFVEQGGQQQQEATPSNRKKITPEAVARGERFAQMEAENPGAEIIYDPKTGEPRIATQAEIDEMNAPADPPQQQQQAKPKGGKKADQAKSPPPPPAGAPSPPPPPAVQQQAAGEKDEDLTCMPFTAEIVKFDGEVVTLEIPGDIVEFEKAFLEAMNVAAKAGQLDGFVDSHKALIKDLKSDTPNLFKRLQAEFDRLAPPPPEEQETPADGHDGDYLHDMADSVGEDDGPAQESFV